MVPPQKFGDGTQTAVQFVNTVMERALNVGMPHSTILQKFAQGTWLGQTAKLKLMNYMRNNVTAFKAKVTTPEESVQNNTIALADYVIL